MIELLLGTTPRDSGIGTRYVKVNDNAILTMVSYASFTPATSKYSQSDDKHAFPASFASVFSLELMIVDKMLVHQSLFVIYLQPTSSKEANAFQVLLVFSQQMKNIDLHTLLLKLYSDLVDILVCIYNLEGQRSEDDVLCTHSSSSLLPLLSSEFGIYQSEVDLLCTRASPSPLPVGWDSVKVDLFCTRASPSPLSLLSSGFGSHLSSLNKLNARDGSFKLSGYISCPDVYTMNVYRPKLMDKRCDKSSFLLSVS
ncbi:hypothetical protein H5410_010764 [Solanum commersonii]|uniref:Uncharacterized protein n=1 Tax=Solanum commersonii TaxID=4109 RepID=A0A9J6AN44_SOLCO|nr:hypothetical protein H5410_010764 [Solanum commersonii]